MNADKDGMRDDKVAGLNQTLTSVENELMGRALDRRDGELDQALDCINRGAEAGVIDIQCGGEPSNAGGEEPSPGDEDTGEAEPEGEDAGGAAAEE
jgi:hypothetical protein